MVELDDALSALAKKNEELAALLELCHFGGMTLEEIATLRQVAPETIRRQLRLAEAWLGSYISKS